LIKKCSFVAILLLCSAAAAAFVPAGQKPSENKEIAKLGAFLGKWNTTGEMKDTPYSKASAPASITDCNWSANRGFLICDQRIQTAAGVRNDLSIYTYNEKNREFAFFGVSRDDPEPRATKLTIEGDLWTYSSDETDGSKRIHFRTTNQFTSPDTVVWRSEYSEDGSHWILMGEGKDARVK
jgi:hypothetical protein